MTEFHHVSVLLDECLEGLDIKPDGIYVDGTLGGAGHSSQIAKRLTTGRLIGIDRDPVALKAAGERLAPYADRVTLVHSNFCEIAQVLKDLEAAIKEAIVDGHNVFISGMARGVDMWAAEIVLELKEKYPDIKLIAAVPFEGFELKWSKENKAQYNDILSKADFVKYICPKFSYSSYQTRNEWMVDHSAKVIAVWNGEKSGTKNTVDYANKCGVELVNIYKNEG